MSWSQMEDEAFDLEAGYSLNRPDERPQETIQSSDKTNSNNNNKHSPPTHNKNFELERIDKLLAQNKTKQAFKITIVHQPTVSMQNNSGFMVALSLLGSPAILSNPLDYIVLSTILVNTDNDEEVDQLTGQTAIIIHENNDLMSLDLHLDDRALPGEYRLTFNLYRIIIIGDTSVKLLCGTLHSKTFQVDNRRAKLQSSTFMSLENSSTAPQLLQKLSSLYQLLAPLKYNSVEELKSKNTQAHPWCGGLMWPRIGDTSDQHYIELYMHTDDAFKAATLPVLLEPQTVTLDDNHEHGEHSFESQLHSPRIIDSELINAFRDKTSQKFWCFIIELAECSVWIQPRHFAGAVRLTCRVKVKDRNVNGKEHVTMPLAYVQRSLPSSTAPQSPQVISDSSEDTEKGDDIEEVSSGSDDERPKKRAKIDVAVSREARTTTSRSQRLSWCDPADLCKYCYDYVNNKHTKKQACALRPPKAPSDDAK